MMNRQTQDLVDFGYNYSRTAAYREQAQMWKAVGNYTKQTLQHWFNGLRNRHAVSATSLNLKTAA